MSGNVKVVTRFRPPNALELREGGDIVVDFPQDDDGSRTTVKLKSAPTTGPEANGFNFDKAFPMGTEQKDVFEFGIKETVDDVINGYNGTIFAYGQTGSGKTYTMMGDIFSDTQKGIIPRITGQIFESIMASPPNTEYLVKVSYMEIYMEKIRDLLAPHNDNLQIHEDKAKGVYVKGLSDFYVGGQDDVYEIMRQGGNARAVSSTNMNAESSRSHSIFLITIQQRNVETGTIKNGNLYLVDLAGSEKVGKTGASGQTLEEAKKINKSLSALGMVINALTDGKSSHIPYRDSKLTRILQESLGGNSRTTLIINCSPCSYNLDETISTLRFGVRAKSIKNSARVNAELSPAELKILLKKSKMDNERFKAYITSLETELKVWRSGEKVPESDWAEVGKTVVGDSTSGPPQTPSGTVSQKSSRPLTPAIEGLKDLSSRPETPTNLSLDKDEREEFLKRENELSDQIFEKENSLKSLENSFKELKDELNFYKEQEERLSNENKENSKTVSEIKLQLEKVTFEHKESSIHMDIIKEQNLDLTNELEELRKSFNSERNQEKEQRDQGKERKKAEKMAKMMADFNAGIVSEKEEQIRETLAKLENLSLSSKDGGSGGGGQLSPEDLNLLKEQLLESQTLVKEHEERIKLTLEENELLNQRREEIENRLFNLESQYDKLLDENLNSESLKQSSSNSNNNNATNSNELIEDFKQKLELQYSNKRETQLNEISDLKKTIELKSKEASNLLTSNESLKNANEELKRAFAITAAGIEGGKNLAESAKEMERVRKNMSNQLMEFDTMKKSLMRDLQNRCEKVVELEISLDESKEQYNNIVRSSNTKTQQKKMAFLERNLEQLTNVQKQLVEQNSNLKKEVALAERKLLTRNERIEALTLNVKESEERLERKSKNFDETIAKFKVKFDSRNENNRNGNVSGPGSVGGVGFGRIAIPIRGGGPQAAGSGGLAQGAPGPQPAGNTPLRHQALQGVQQGQFDSNSPKARSSWFFSSSSK